MTDDRSPPDALRALIAHELETPGPSDADRERIHARVAATVGIAAGAAAISGTANASGASANATGALSGTANATGASANTTGASANATGASAKVAAAGAKIGLVGGKLVVLGVVVSAVTAVVIATRSEPARPVPPKMLVVPAERAPVETPSPSPRVSPEPAHVETRSPSPNVSPEPAPVTTSSPSPNVSPEPAHVETRSPSPKVSPEPAPEAVRAPPRRAAVPEQSTLLAHAWTALSGGKAAEALDLVELDLRNHQAGPLDEEREALRIRALVELGRLDEARKLVVAFAQRYPTSIQLSLLERLTKTGDGKQ